MSNNVCNSIGIVTYQFAWTWLAKILYYLTFYK